MTPWENYSPNPSVPWSTVTHHQTVTNIPQPYFPSNLIEMLPPHPFRDLRKAANTQGGVLLIYHVIMTFAVMIVMFAVTFVWAFESSLGGGADSVEDIVDLSVKASGWGYLLTVFVGMTILLLWKKPWYLRHTVFQKGRSITAGGFFALLSVMMSAQLVVQVCNIGLTYLLDSIGLDGFALQELGNIDTDSLSMFLYIGIIAPISEEVLFRGLLLRSIEPYGKKLAVIGSAILFGLYHGSPIQTPYAILVGVVLGYVALEYHVVWAIAMHIFNNLVFAMLLPKALSFLPVQTVDMILWIIMILFFIAAVVVLLCKRREVAGIWNCEKIQKWQRQAFFRAPTIVVLIVVCLINLVATTLLLFV